MRIGKNLLWLVVGSLLALSLVLASCGEAVEEEEEEGPPPTEEEGVVEEEEEEGPPVTGDWWDKFGEPEYGGTITVARSSIGGNWDNISFGGGGYYYEPLFFQDWTLDRNIWSFVGRFAPDEYWKGNLVESWQIPDLQTIVCNIRKGVYWQDKPPVNGREFTAHDVQAHYERQFVLAVQFFGMYSEWESVTATDDYTVVYKFKTPGGQYLQAISDAVHVVEPPEWAALSEQERNKWQNAVGTGPWILTDYIANNLQEYSKNPTYFGYDERYPDNQIPYVDTLSAVLIADPSTRLAALRTAKVDYLGVDRTRISWQQADTLAKTNPEIVMGQIPEGSAGGAFRLDKEPFTDINVRKALNMAIDRDTIAKTHYGGFATGKPNGLVSSFYTGFAFDYDDWPQELKDEYAYDPEGARQLLADAGYPNGFQTNIVVSADSDLDLMQIFKAYFSDIGVDMTINTLDWAQYEAVRRAAKHDQMVGEGGGFTWPLTRSLEQFYSKGPDAAQFQINDAVYDDLRYQFFAAPNPAEAKRIASECDRRVIEQHWLVQAGEYFSFNCRQPYLKGHSGEIMFGGEHLILARLWIDHDMKKSMGR